MRPFFRGVVAGKVLLTIGLRGLRFLCCAKKGLRQRVCFISFDGTAVRELNAKMKKRLIGVSGVIVIVLILVLAFVGSGTAAKTVSVAEAAEMSSSGQKVQVSGNVVPDSFTTKDDVLTFKIYDPNGSPTTQLEVRYDGAASSTFGNDVTAICTGKIDDGGVLACSELVTKCPSKYESAENALTVGRLMEYGDSIVSKTVKVSGKVDGSTLKAAGQSERFVIVGDEGARLPVVYDGALSEEVADGTAVVLTGSLNAEGKFVASDVAIEG